jgi:hypothetical protein
MKILKSVMMSAGLVALLPLAASAQLLQWFPFPTHSVPELDPSSAGTALSLLVGGMLMLSSRRRARR